MSPKEIIILAQDIESFEHIDELIIYLRFLLASQAENNGTIFSCQNRPDTTVLTTK
ncbi:MAG: hypothetical protein RR365_14060 [Bacteroides sp.]